MNPHNGEMVTRAELHAHLEVVAERHEATARELKYSIDHLARAVEELTSKVEAPKQWLGNRATVLIDRWLPAAIFALIVVITRYLN